MRRFMCTSDDLSRYEHKVKTNAIKNDRTLEEHLRWLADTISDYFIRFNILMDQSSIDSLEEFNKNPTPINAHMFTHHMMYQVVKALDNKQGIFSNGGPATVRDIGLAESFRLLTEDCLEVAS